MKIYRTIKNCLLSLFRKRTIGARALVIKNNHVLLVKHTYMPGWYSIGGGVDCGESPKQSIIRELQEEVGVTAESIILFNVYLNSAEKRDDYVIFYICTDITEQDIIDKQEIAEKKWFKLDDLPDAISPATRRRILEYQGKSKKSDIW